MNDIAFLVSTLYTQDDIGNNIETLSEQQIFCEIKSASQKEFFQASQSGMKSEKYIKMWKDEYHEEKYVKIEGKLYSVYRTYEKNDYIELYLETRIGN